jgi:hypothetical protein
MSVAMTTANDVPANQPRRRGPGRPFEKGVSQTHLFAQTRSQMEAEVISDLEAGGRKVSSADRLLVQRYVQLLRSKSHSDVNTALKVFTTLTSKYAGKDAPNTSAFDKYVAALQAKDAAK